MYITVQVIFTTVGRVDTRTREEDGLGRCGSVNHWMMEQFQTKKVQEEKPVRRHVAFIIQTLCLKQSHNTSGGILSKLIQQLRWDQPWKTVFMFLMSFKGFRACKDNWNYTEILYLLMWLFTQTSHFLSVLNVYVTWIN